MRPFTGWVSKTRLSADDRSIASVGHFNPHTNIGWLNEVSKSAPDVENVQLGFRSISADLKVRDMSFTDFKGVTAVTVVRKLIFVAIHGQIATILARGSECSYLVQR